MDPDRMVTILVRPKIEKYNFVVIKKWKAFDYKYSPF